jgi:hypothetical protein
MEGEKSILRSAEENLLWTEPPALRTHANFYNADNQSSTTALPPNFPRNVSGRERSERSARSPFFRDPQKPSNEEKKNIMD